MPSGRGVAVLFAGLAMWLVARIIGSPGLEVIALGLAALPAIAAIFVHRGHQRIIVHRRLSDIRVSPGTRVTVHIDIENRSAAATSFLLLEDRLPSVAGPPGQARRLGDPGARHPRGDVHDPAADPRSIPARATHGGHVGPVRAGASATRVRRT